MLNTKGFQYNICFGSTSDRADLIGTSIEFQYNICFGSTITKGDYPLESVLDFNTTFVSVRQKYTHLK